MVPFEPHKPEGAEPIDYSDRRSSPRIRISLAATSRASGDVRRLRADVSDLSTEGCKLYASGLHQNEEVWVGIAHLTPMPATVCWVHGPAVGLKFRTKLHESVVRHLTGR